MSRTKLRAMLPGLWRAFLRRHFRDPAEVAAVFGVARSTAYLWWSGDGSPDAATIVQVYDSERADALRETLRQGRGG